MIARGTVADRISVQLYLKSGTVRLVMISSSGSKLMRHDCGSRCRSSLRFVGCLYAV
jgi:hypothetical protein